MSCQQLSTKELSTDDYSVSLIDANNSKLILDLINSGLQKSYLDASFSSRFWKTEEIYAITNEKLEADYREKCDEMKTSHENLYPTTLFTCYRTHGCLNDIAVHGLRTKVTGFNILGDNSKGVTLCQHADIQLKAAEAKPSRCFLFIFTCTSSRIARIDCCNQGRNSRPPVSGCDCHVSAIRPNLDDSLLVQAVRAQIYFYDVHEGGAYFSRPRQCLPLACIVYTRSECGEEPTSVPIKHFEVGKTMLSAEGVVDLTGPDDTCPLLDEAKGARIYSRLQRHFQNATSAEDIYSLSNYFPKPVGNENLSIAASSLPEKDASRQRVAQSSSQPTVTDTSSTPAVVTITDAGEERSAPVAACQDDPAFSLIQKMSQFCVNRTQKNAGSVPSSVALPNAVSSAVGIIMAENVVPSTGGTTYQSNTVSTWSIGTTAPANTVSWATFVPNVNVQDATFTGNATTPRAPGTTTVGASFPPRTLTLMGVSTAAATASQILRASLVNTAGRAATVGPASMPQCPRLVRYLPRILKSASGSGGIRLNSNSTAATVAMSSVVSTGRSASVAMPTLHATSNIVKRAHSMAFRANMPSFNGVSIIRPNTLHASNTIPRITQPQSVAMMAAMSPSSFSVVGGNIRPTASSSATQLIPQFQAMLPRSPLQTVIPLYADCSALNFLAQQNSNYSPQAQLTWSAASQQVSLSATPINPAGMVSPISQSPFILHVPPNLAQFTVTRSADQQRPSSFSATGSENNLFFGGSEVEGVTIEDEGLVISGVRPFVIMPDGTCDEDDEQNCSSADGVQGNAETKAVDCKKVSDCDKAILKMEENSTCSRAKNRNRETIILDADLPLNEFESNSNVIVRDDRLVDQEMDEDEDLLDRQLRISDVVSLQTDSDVNDSSVVNRRLLGDLWMENAADQLDPSVRPVENSLSSTNCEIISLGSDAVQSAAQVSESLVLERAEIVAVAEMCVSDQPVQRSTDDDCSLPPTSSQGLVILSPQMQHDAQALNDKVGEKAVENQLATSDDGYSNKRGSHKQSRTTLLKPTAKKQKPLPCDLSKLAVSGLQTHERPSAKVCLPASEESTSATNEASASATNEASARQRQSSRERQTTTTIPVFTVGADGSVSIRLDNESEANEDMHCDARIELLGDVQEKDTLMKSLAGLFGNIHVTDLRNSCDEIVGRSWNKNAEEIASSSLNLQRHNLSKGNGVEQRTGSKKDSFASHTRARPNSDNNANDINIVIESVHSMELEKFDEISESSGNAKPVDLLSSDRVISKNKDVLKRLSDTMVHTSRGNSVENMTTSDFEENDVENDESVEDSGDEPVSVLQTTHRLQRQSKFSDVTCSTESSNAKLNDSLSGIEDVTQLAPKNHSTKLNKRRALDLTDKSGRSRIINKEVPFECENSGLNEELSSNTSHNVRVHEEDHSMTCEELPLDSGVESEISTLQTKTPSDYVNRSKPSKGSLDSTLETSRMDEQQLIDAGNESETCNMSRKQPVSLETESETCGINNKQALPLANEQEMLGINQELRLDSGNEHNSFRTCEELHQHMSNEHMSNEHMSNEHMSNEHMSNEHMSNEHTADLAKESETSCRTHEEQHLDLPSESEPCRTSEGQQSDPTSELLSGRTQEEQHLDLAGESESCRTNRRQQSDLASELELHATNKGQHLDLPSESDICRLHEEQQSESCRIHEEPLLDLSSESKTDGIDKQQLNLTIDSELCKANEEHPIDLTNESDTCSIYEEQHIDLTNESDTSSVHEEQLLDSKVGSELCRTREELLIDLLNDSDTCRIQEGPLLNSKVSSESCRTHKEQHSDLASESETVGIDEQPPLEIAEETCILCEEQPLELSDELPITRTSKELPLDLTTERGVSSSVYEDPQIANAVNSNFKNAETLLLGCLDSVTPACVTEAVSPISPACATEDFSFAHLTDDAIPSAHVTETTARVTETISPAILTEAISPAFVTEAISPAYVTEAISPVYVTEAISPAYITEPISPPYVTEPISPPACSDESVFPTDTYRPVTEDVSPPCNPADSPVAQAVTSVHETDAVITSDGFLCSIALQPSDSETNFSRQYISKNDMSIINTGISGAGDYSAVLDVLRSENKHCVESMKKTVTLDSQTSHLTSNASETKGVTRKKRVLSLKDYKQLKGSMRQADSLNNLKTQETRVENSSLTPSSAHLDKDQTNVEKSLDVEGSGHSQLVTFRSTGPEEKPTNNDQGKIMNPAVNFNLKLAKKAMEKTSSAVIDSMRQRDPRLQSRGYAFKNADITLNKKPIVINLKNSETVKRLARDDKVASGKDDSQENAGARLVPVEGDMEKGEEVGEHMLPKKQSVDLDEHVMEVVVEETQQPLVNDLQTEVEESSSQHMDKLRNDIAVEDMNGKASKQKDGLDVELIEGGKEQENAVERECKVIDPAKKDKDIKGIVSYEMEPGEIEDEIEDKSCDREAEAVVVKQVVNKQVVEVLDDWDEYGDFVIVGSGLDVLSDDDKESGEVTSDSSDEFGDLVINDGADDEDECDCIAQQRQSVDKEADQEQVWHLLDDALTVGDNCEGVKCQRKGSDKKCQNRRRPIIINLKNSDTVKRLARADKLSCKGDCQVNAAGLKENSEGTKVIAKCHSNHSRHRKRKSRSKNGCRSHRTRRNNHAGNCELPSAEHMKTSDEKHGYHRPSEDQWDIHEGAVRQISSEGRGCTPIDVEIIKVLRNVDDVSAERSICGGADSFVTLLMKEFQHLPEESQRYYNDCVRQTLQVDREFVTSEHIYGSMAELLTEEQRQHIQQTNISPVVARELHLEDILKKVKLELSVIKPDSGCDLSHRNLLILTKEMLYDQMNELKCYQKSNSVFVLPDEFRLTREYGKYISVDGSLLFLSRCTLSVTKCCKLYCYRMEIEEMEDELNESLGGGGGEGATEEICRKLSVLYLKRRHCLQDIGCSADQLQALKKKFSKNLSWFRTMRDVLQSRDRSEGQEMALVNCLNQRIGKLRQYITVITSLKNVSGVWYPENSERL